MTTNETQLLILNRNVTKKELKYYTMTKFRLGSQSRNLLKKFTILIGQRRKTHDDRCQKILSQIHS